MLTSTVVRMRAMNEGRLPLAVGEYGHAAFFHLIREVAPDFARALHDAGKRQPFTVSPLWGEMRRKGREWRVATGAECWMRFTILDPTLYASFSRYFADARFCPVTLNLGEVCLAVEVVETQQGVWSGYTTFEQLLEGASADPVIPLRFHTLTAFHLGEREGVGSRIAMFPEPALVFESLLAKWNTFAPIRIDPGSLRELLSEYGVLVNRYRLESGVWRFRHHPQQGFTGYCVYEAKGAGPEERRILNALADFAFYAGVGHHTTMGMGQCRRMRSDRGNDERQPVSCRK